MVKYFFYLLVPITLFSQTREYKKREKSESFRFLTDTEKMFYIKNIIPKALNLGYELYNNDEGNIVFEDRLSKFVLLTKRINKDSFFPPYSVGSISKKIYFSGDNFEDGIKTSVITEIKLIEYSNVSSSAINKFFNSTVNYIQEDIRNSSKKSSRFISEELIYKSPFYYNDYDNSYNIATKYTYSRITNIRFPDEGRTISSFLIGKKNQIVTYSDGDSGRKYALAIQHHDEFWDDYIKLIDTTVEFSKNKSKTLNKLRENIGDKNLKNINTYDLQEMVQFFLDDCKRSNIIVSSIETLSATFEPLEDGVIALAFGMNNDDQIVIRVDPTNWQKSDLIKKWYVIYHELGHDVLNLDHGEGGKMMFNFVDREYTWDEFYNDKDYMFNYVLKRQ